MKPILFFILVFVSFLPSTARAQSPLIAKTGAPTLLADEGGFSFAMDEKTFTETSRRISALMPNVVGIRKKPAQLTAAALFGLNLSIQGKNVSWILDRDAQNEYVLYADFNADGDLSNDKPLNFKKTGGRNIVEIHKTLTETIDRR